MSEDKKIKEIGGSVEARGFKAGTSVVDGSRIGKRWSQSLRVAVILLELCFDRVVHDMYVRCGARKTNGQPRTID